MRWHQFLSSLAYSDTRRRKAVSRLSESVEHFEPRVLPTAMVDLKPVLVQPPAFASTGTSIKVTTEIENIGQKASPKVKVEYRLSRDDVIDQQDLLLTTITRAKIQAGKTSRFTQQIRLPAGLSDGQYHIGVILDPQQKVVEANDSNNVIASADAISITKLHEKLTGQVTYQKSIQSVEIRGIKSGVIDPALTTWLVIHGRNQSASSDNMKKLSQQISIERPGDQVLVLDWATAAASGSIGGQGENFIQPVAAWAAKALTGYGFTGQNLNLVGYSWGAEIASEMAEVLGRVNSILAIDPARDYPGGSYNPEKSGEVNLRSHADQSWAFYATSIFPFGNASIAVTAEEAFVLTGSDHFGIVDAVTSLIALPTGNQLGDEFALQRLLSGQPTSIALADNYSDTGGRDGKKGKFEGILVATSDGQAVASLRYFDGKQEVTMG